MFIDLVELFIFFLEVNFPHNNLIGKYHGVNFYVQGA